MIGRLLKRIQRIIKLQIYFVTTTPCEEEERLSCSLMFSRIPNFSMSVLVRFAGALVTELLLESFLSARLAWGRLLLLQSWMRDFILSRRWLVWMDCTAHRGIPAKAVWQRLTMVLDNQNDACQVFDLFLHSPPYPRRRRLVEPCPIWSQGKNASFWRFEKGGAGVTTVSVCLCDSLTSLLIGCRFRRERHAIGTRRCFSYWDGSFALRYMCSSVAFVCQLTHPYKYASSNLLTTPHLSSRSYST